jgi:hypothetical protein
MRTLEITLWTLGVFVASIAMYAFFPIAITVLGLISLGLIAREMGYHYDESYNREARNRALDENHQHVKVIRLKHFSKSA